MPTQHARTRALVTLGGMIVGIVLSRELPSTSAVVWFSIACGCIAGSIPAAKHYKSILFVIGIVALGAGIVQLRTHEPPGHRLDRLIDTDSTTNQRAPIEVTGMLLDPIETQFTARSPGDPPTWKTTRVMTRVSVERVYMSDSLNRGTWVQASGILRVLLPMAMSEKSGLEAGDRVELFGLYTPPGSKRNFGDLDWSALSAQSGRVGTIVVSDESMINPSDYAGMFDRFSGRVSRFQAAVRVRALRALGLSDTKVTAGATTDGSVLGALLLGERDPSFQEVYESFQRVGVAHVLAISGFHLALVILLGVLMIRLIGEHAKIETAIIITILILGALVIPMRPPIVRAGVIVIVLLIAGRLGRRYDRLTVLGWVGVGLLIWRPMDAFSLGYQLSMGITGLLVILSNQENTAVLNRSTFTTTKMQHGRGFVGKLTAMLVNAIKVNFACWAVAMPTIAYHAGIVSVLAPVVSLILIPMVIVLMVLGYLQITLGVISPELAPHTLGVVDWSAANVGGFIGWVDSMPGSSIRIGMIGWVWTLGATLFVAAVVTRRLKVRTWGALGIGIGLIAWAIGSSMLMSDRATLRIDMLDVGDGSCVLIQSAGEGLIWDCGSLDRRVGDSAARAARQVGIARIRDAIVTHDNIDHFNGLIDLAQAVGLERVWITQRMSVDPSASWSAYESRLIAMGISIHELGMGTVIEIGEVTLECLWPDPELIESMSENNTSIVMRVVVPIELVAGEYQTRSVLMTGDIERDAMEAIMRSHPNLRAGILELPHHGSIKPGAFEFVSQLNPSVVLQSTGPSRLNNPHWNDLQQSRQWFTTADQGGVWVQIMRDGEVVYGWAAPKN